MIECSGKNSLLKAIRTSDNLNYPLGLTYEISGSAQQGSDFEMMNGFMIIPAYTFFQNDTLKVIKDEIVESAENIIVSPNPSSLFNNVPAPMSIWVYDCGATGIKKRHSDNVFSVFPNPATDHIQINFAEDYNGRIQVVNMRGQEVLSCKVQGRVIRIDTNVFESGYYLVRVIVNERYFNQKLIKI